MSITAVSAKAAEPVATPATARRIRRWPWVIEVTGRSRSSLHEDIHAGRFPKPVRIGPRAVGFYEDAVLAWLNAREFA